MHLAPPPSSLFAPDGSARFGAYEGPLGPIDFAGSRDAARRGALWRSLHHKRWAYAFAKSHQHVVAAAVVHLGYAGTCFLTVLDRKARALLYDHSAITLPQLVHVGRRSEEGCDVQFRGAGARIAFTRPMGSSRYLLAADTARASVRITFETEGTPAPIAAISPVEHGVINVTAKRVLMPARGVITVDDMAEQVHGLGGMDYTNGLLARRTRWRWAFGMGTAIDGRAVAFNLVDGYNGGHECAVWLDGVLAPTESARFTFDPKRPVGTWSVGTPDGRVALSFRGDAMHAEPMELGAIRSAFIQSIGTYSGEIRVPGHPPASIADVCGVVENQDVTW